MLAFDLKSGIPLSHFVTLVFGGCGPISSCLCGKVQVRINLLEEDRLWQREQVCLRAEHVNLEILGLLGVDPASVFFFKQHHQFGQLVVMLGDIIPKFPQGYFREENLIDGTIGFGKSFSATSTEKLLRIPKFGSHCGLDLDNLGFMELRAWIAEILIGRFGATNIYSSCTFFLSKEWPTPWLPSSRAERGNAASWIS